MQDSGGAPPRGPTPPSGAPADGQGSRALRNTAIVLAARVASRLVALVTVIATLSHLGAAGSGQFGNLVNLTALVTVLLDLGFNTLYVREGARNRQELGRYLGNLISVRALMAVPAFGVLALILAGPGLEYLLLPGFVLMLLASYSSLIRNSFYALQRLNYEAAAIVLESLVLLSLTLVGIRTARGVAWFLWSYAASYGFSCLFILTVLIGRRMMTLRLRLEPAFIRTWFWQGLPLAASFVITTIYFKIDVPILQHFRGDVETGWYVAAYKPFESLLFVPITMLNVVFPILAVFHRESPNRVAMTVSRFYRSLLLLGWPITVGTFLLAPGLNRFLPFPESEAALAILSIGIVAMFVNNAFIGALNSIDRQRAFTWAAAASMVVNIGLNLALIPTHGYLAAAWVTVVTEFFLVAAGWALTARYLAPIPLHRLSWRILLAGAVMGLVLYPLRGAEGRWVAAVIGLGALVYAAAVLLLRAVDTEELALLRRAVGRPAP